MLVVMEIAYALSTRKSREIVLFSIDLTQTARAKYQGNYKTSNAQSKSGKPVHHKQERMKTP